VNLRDLELLKGFKPKLTQIVATRGTDKPAKVIGRGHRTMVMEIL